MEDSQIVELYWSRGEEAVAETAKKYGKYCYSIAYRILGDDRDAEEAVNDTYMGAWNSMPPHRPSALSTFLGKLTRRISINRWRARRADKRGGGQLPVAMEELTEALPAPDTPEQLVEARELTASIDRFLASLPEEERDLFVCRYWYFASIAELGAAFGAGAGKIKSKLFRTRNKLKVHLEQEGFL